MNSDLNIFQVGDTLTVTAITLKHITSVENLVKYFYTLKLHCRSSHVEEILCGQPSADCSCRKEVKCLIVLFLKHFSCSEGRNKGARGTTGDHRRNILRNTPVRIRSLSPINCNLLTSAQSVQALQKKSWVAQFKEFRAYGECVLDYLRSQVRRLTEDLSSLTLHSPGDERSLRPEGRHGPGLGRGCEGPVLLAGGDQQDREVQPLHVQGRGSLLRQV